MKKINSPKGITLVASIITIVIMLILAVIAVSLINDEEIIEKSQESSSAYKDKVEEEEEKILYGEELIDKYLTSTKTLTIKGNAHLTETMVISYELGMTWEQWCNSKYNTCGAYVGNNGWIYRTSDNAKIYAGIDENDDLLYNIAKLEIDLNRTYTWMP